MNKILPFLCAFLLHFSCDTILEGERLIPVNEVLVRKNILLEDYTGMRCPNCPVAAATAAQLKQTYGERLILVTIHTGIYAQPAGIFTSDFRTTPGDVYNSFFGFNAYPVGLIDRSSYNGKTPLFREQWGGAVQARAQLPSPIDIRIKTNKNDSNRVKIETSIRFLETISDQLVLQLWLVEDSIVAPQLDGSKVIYDYVHRHVLRGAINTAWGEDVIYADKNLQKGDSIMHTHTYTIDPDWKTRHCSVVGFVYKKTDRTIMQCIEQKLID